MWTMGKLNAIGFSPFGIDRNAGPNLALGQTYDVLGQVAPLILEHQAPAP